MDTSLSRMLSASRWLAVLAVVLYHVRFLLFASFDQVHEKGLLLKLFYFGTGLGHEGFVLYMVTGGMLMGGLSSRRWALQGPRAWRDVAHKMHWFYAFLVPALLFGGLLDFVGSCVLRCTGVYAYFGQFTPDFSLKAVTENLLPVQRFIVPGLGSNSMLYLLAYECWAYVVFAAFMLFGKRRFAALAAGAIALQGVVLAPEFFGYLLLWLIGALLVQYRERFKIPVSGRTALVIFLLTLLTSRITGTYLGTLPANGLLVARTCLDLQFGAGVCMLLLSLRSNLIGHRAAVMLSILNRRFPSGSSVILASHFPFMMYAVASVSHHFGMPIAGEPRPVLFALFGSLVVAIAAYGWAVSRFADILVWSIGHRRGLELTETFPEAVAKPPGS